MLTLSPACSHRCCADCVLQHSRVQLLDKNLLPDCLHQCEASCLPLDLLQRAWEVSNIPIERLCGSFLGPPVAHSLRAHTSYACDSNEPVKGHSDALQLVVFGTAMQKRFLTEDQLDYATWKRMLARYEAILMQDALSEIGAVRCAKPDCSSW